MRFASKACPRASRPPAWRPMSRPIASACWSRPPARCSWSARSKAPASARSSAWMWGYVAMAALVLIGTVTALAATEPEQSARAEAATRGESRVRARACMRRSARSREFLTRKRCLAALAFVVLFKFTDAFSGTMTAPFVIDLGFTRNDYAAIVKGVGLAATLIGGFAGGFVARRYSLVDEPVDRRRAAGGRPICRSPGSPGRRQSMGAGRRHHGGKFHRRDRHRDLRRLSVGAVPEPAAHRDPIRAAHRAGRGRAHLSVLGRGLCGGGDGLAAVLRDLASWSRCRA